IHERPQESGDRYRPQGPRRSRRVRQGRIYQDRGAGQSLSGLIRRNARGRRDPPPFFCAHFPMNELERIVAAAEAEFTACADPAALENAKARYLGKAGALTELLKSLGKLPAADRPAAGARINAAKVSLETALAARRNALAEAKLTTQLAAEALDVSLPGRGYGLGGLHPITRTLERMEALFR